MESLQNINNDVKQIIKENYDGKYYDGIELLSIIHDIINAQNSNNNNIRDINTYEELATFVLQYLHYSKNDTKYYFNSKRKHLKQLSYHKTILNTCKNSELFVHLNSTIDDLNVLEKELFGTVSDVITVTDIIDTTNLTDIVNVNDTANNVNTFNNSVNKNDICDNTEYHYPENKPYKYKRPSGPLFEPYGTQWIHDIQIDDIWGERETQMSKQFDVLRAIKLPEQRTPEWFKMRDGKITASDGGTVVNMNHHEAQFKFILKKTMNPPFLSNEFVHHGKKYEDVATAIYEYRMNVLTDEFGLIGHPVYDFLGASPDRICTKYKLDGIHKTKYVGRMLEIKCPYVRKINMDGPIFDHIVPKYYWVQTQLQLECCDLEECDFWQCTIREYSTRMDFIDDTDPNEPFRSKQTGLEKGCIIQLLPKSRMEEVRNGRYNQVVWDDAKYIYPNKIEMSPYDCDLWVMESLNDMQYDSQYNDYYFDKVIYWKLTASKNVLVNRDREWFKDNLPVLKQMWEYVLFLREHNDKLKILSDFINAKFKDKPLNDIKTKSQKINNDIISYIHQLCDIDNPNYTDNVNNIIEKTKLLRIALESENDENNDNNENNENDGYTRGMYAFINADDNDITDTTNNTNNMNNRNPRRTYAFINTDNTIGSENCEQNNDIKTKKTTRTAKKVAKKVVKKNDTGIYIQTRNVSIGSTFAYPFI